MMRSEVIYIIKAFAILSVLSAHVCYDEAVDIYDKMAHVFLNNYGTIGVSLFFIISGYLFWGKEYPWKLMVKKKVKTLIIPWFVVGTLVYLQVFQLYNPNNWLAWYKEKIIKFEGIAWLKFIIGINSLYYYMTVLIVCYIIFKLVGNRVKIGLGITIASLIFVLICGEKLFFPTRYLNPFNWIGYFGVGYYLAMYGRTDFIDKLEKKKAINKTAIIMLSIISLTLISLMGIKVTYFSWYYLLFLAVEGFGIILVSDFIVNRCNILKWIFMFMGKESYYIYLTHMLIQSLPIKYLNGNGALTILRPLFLFIITVLIILAIRFLFLQGRKLFVH